MTYTFKQEYYDINNEKELFQCHVEPVENKKFCSFHDDTYLKDPKNNDNVITKLYHIIDDCISQNMPLLYIGYYLPDVEIKRV